MYNKLYFCKQKESKTFLSKKASNNESISELALHEQKGSKVSLMTEKTYKKEELPSKKLNVANELAIRKIYSRDLKLRYEYR